MDKSKRNRLAGTGKSKSYKDKTPAQIAAKRKYDSEYQKSPERVKYRVELNKKNRANHANGKSKVGDGKDVSHTKTGKLVLESQKSNRGRNGKGNKNSLK